ncbi:MAG TPA: ATP-binding protein [Paracoccaceae bacterium]|nr:ATP-binding protein [Paracoccaceae bacterium]HMO70945.1 ATP-binding protein [Paracoccaceae bacterium]
MTIAGDPASVRAGLCALMAAPPLAGLPSDLRQDAELVLAEVLNNIAEHAYAAGPGPIEVQLLPDRGGFACIVRDRGTAMPGGTLPAGLPPSPDGPNPPEGGFGWHLIRSLVQDLSYVRDAAGNKLTFRISRC